MARFSIVTSVAKRLSATTDAARCELASAAVTRRPISLVHARLLLVSTGVGVVVALGFVGFEWLLEHAHHYLWVTVAGDDPAALVTIGLATAGGLALGLALRFMPGHGGHHPAEGHGLLIGGGAVTPAIICGSLVVGFVGLAGGASLGPEGAMLPAAAGVSLLAAHWCRVPAAMTPLVQGAGLAALLAAMFGSPLAGVVPLMELSPVATASSMTLLVLPSLASAAAAALTLQVLESEPLGTLPFVYEGFEAPHLLWALLIGVLAGAVGLMVARVTVALRRFTIRLDARSVLLTSVVGGLVLGVLYVIGGTNVRFAGVPELVYLVDDTDHAWAAIGAMAIKVLATGWCLAAGYRGGKIFPVAFAGGAAGLALHLAFPSLPLALAVGVSLACAIATGLGSPVTAALIAAMLLGPTILPLAVLGVVAAHTVHLLAEQLDIGVPTAPTGPDTAAAAV